MVLISTLIGKYPRFPVRAMSAILFPIRLCQNPIRTHLFQARIGPAFSRILPGLTRFQRGQPSGLTRIAAHSNPSMGSEKEAALAAAAANASTSPDSPTIFDKIISKEIPANIVYEDEKVLAFKDINPQAPTHILIIPKVKDGLSALSKAEETHCNILGRLLYTAKLVAKQEGLEDGFRVVINDGPAGCQSVYHIHVHLLGGRQLNWPPG